jgi:hypothetical protein
LDAYEKKKERDRMYQQERRAKQRLLASGSSEESSDSKTTPSSDVAVSEEDKDIDKEKDKDINNKPGKTAGKKPAKKKYGEFQNVLLTDPEYEKLEADFGNLYLVKAIDFLDAYIEEKGYKSKSHNLAIRRWVMDAVKENEAKPKRYGGRKEKVPGWFGQPELGSAEIEAVHKLLGESQEEDFSEEAEQLRRELQESFGRNN